MQEREVVEEEEMVGELDDEVEVKHDTKKDIVKAESDEDTDSYSSDEEMEEGAIQRRRDLMRQKAAMKAQAGMTAQEILAKEEERARMRRRKSPARRRQIVRKRREPD